MTGVKLSHPKHYDVQLNPSPRNLELNKGACELCTLQCGGPLCTTHEGKNHTCRCGSISSPSPPRRASFPVVVRRGHCWCYWDGGDAPVELHRALAMGSGWGWDLFARFDLVRQNRLVTWESLSISFNSCIVLLNQGQCRPFRETSQPAIAVGYGPIRAQ